MKTRAGTRISRGIVFLLDSSHSQSIQCLGGKSENAESQRDPSVPRIVMRRDIISTSSRDAILWQNRQAPTLPKAAGHWAMGVGGGGHGTRHGGREACTSMARQRLGGLVANDNHTTTSRAALQCSRCFSAIPVPHPPFPVPRDHPRLPHLSMSRPSTPTLVGKAALSCWS